MSSQFEEKLSEMNIVLTQKQREQFSKYYEMLVEWNKVMNLTGITEYEEVYEKHFLDSISIVKIIPISNLMDKSKKSRMIDIGTGAGFPGIPLKIVFPELEIVLLDSLNKRIKFLNAVIKNLGLEKIVSIHGRAEDFAKLLEYREQFDYCVSRAVANLAILSEYCIPYIKIGGSFIPYKSGEIDEELEQSQKAIQILGGEIECVEKFQLPGSGMGRSFVNIKKVEHTADKYPRKAGKPEKSPLS